MKLLTENLELRGIKNTVSGKGNIYYTLNCEGQDGDPVQFYCKDASAFPEGLKKGDKIRISLDFNQKYKSLVVEKVEKVGA